MKFKSDIEVQAGLKDSSGSSGNAGSILSSTSTGVTWIDNYADWTSVVKHIVKNNGLNGTITKGTAVYVTGSNGTNMLVGRASNVSEASSSKTMGLMQSDITTTGGTQTGFVITEGLLSGLNTAGQTAGDPVWLGVNGALIYGLINKPYAPAHLVFIGIVTKVSAGSGEIFVKVQNGFELKEIHDVDIITNVPINGDILGFNGTLWVNKTIAGWLGYTPANASGTVNYVCKFTGTTALGNSQIFDNGTNVGIGTTSPAAKLHIDLPSGAFGSGYPYNILSYGNSNVFKTYMDGNWNYVNEVIQNGVNQSGYIISTNGSERMRITSSGNVGIGTTSPSYKFQTASSVNSDWVGSFYNTSTTTPNGLQVRVGVSSAAQALGVYTDGIGYTFNVLGNGSVGIGTTSPSQKLSVVGNIYANGGFIGYRVDGGTGLEVNGGDLGTGSYIAKFSDFSNNPKFVINGAGNVGVGTTNVYDRLTLGGGKFYLSYAAGADIGGAMYSYLDSSYQPYAGGLRFQTFRNPTGTYQMYDTMTLTGSGNMLLGDTVQPSAPWRGTAVFGINGASKVIIGNLNSSYTGATIGGHTSALDAWDDLNIVGGNVIFRVNETEKMRLATSGNLGIGTSSPSYKLDVAGGIATTTNSVIAGTFSFINLESNSSKLNCSRFLAIQETGSVGIGYNSDSVPVGAKFLVNGNSYFNGTLLATGNVGIGTTSPLTKLHIEGDASSTTDETILTLKGNGENGKRIDFRNAFGSLARITGTKLAGGASADEGILTFETATNSVLSEKMRITSSGNVGIGTTSPSAKLSLAGPSELIWLQENSAYISFYNTANSIRTGYIQANTGSNITIMPEASNALILGAGGNERIRITSAGNVGIGITAPGSKLEVAGNIKSNGGYGEGFVLNDNSSITRENVGMGFNTNSTQRLLISTGGNIGIGTTNPIYKLDVNGTSNITNSLYVGGNLGVGTTMPTTKVDIVDTMTNPTLRLAYVPMSGYGGGGNIDFVGGSFDYVNGAISWKNGTTVQGQVDYSGFNRMMTLTSQSTITFKTTLMERMRIDSTGQVGIGTSSPMYTLHVNGSVAGTSAYINLSDERYKKDILPIENALDKVLSLNGVTFNWDKGFNQRVNLDNNNHIGLIAQEVEKIIPQAVSTASDDNQTKSVAYSDLVPVLIEAIKELKSEIEELKKLINK